MRVLLYILVVLIVLVGGILGIRGKEWSHDPQSVFDDMARQDRAGAQSGAARDLPPGTVPRGIEGEIGKPSGKIVFTSRGGSYYETGVWEGYYGQGLPEELKPADEKDAVTFLKQGETQFLTHCAVCHGASANGKGTAASYPGFPVLVDLNDAMYCREKYPDGRIFFVITHGQGNMTSYGAALPVNQRWRIVSYLRALQRVRGMEGQNGKGEKSYGE